MILWVIYCSGNIIYIVLHQIIGLTEVESTIGYRGQEDTNHNAIYLNILALMVVYLKIPNGQKMEKI